jgi:hypothetical protein
VLFVTMPRRIFAPATRVWRRPRRRKLTSKTGQVNG